MAKCYICDTNAAEIVPINFFYEVICPNCGNFTITLEAWQDLPRFLDIYYKDKRYIWSGILRERTELGLSDKLLTNENFSKIYHSVNVPVSIRQKLDKILIFLHKHTKKYHDVVYIPSESVAYAVDREELRFLIKALGEEKFIGTQPNENCYLTINGIERVEQLLYKPVKTNQCFVAMWFNTEMDEVFGNYIVPAIEAKNLDGTYIKNEKSYKPIKVDWLEFNKDILDNIVSEIRKSRFMVADFTENKNGVYFEAGFAEGLGLDVIYTCREDFKSTIHFDVNHQNYIFWKDGQDLYNKLRKRISATIV